MSWLFLKSTVFRKVLANYKVFEPVSVAEGIKFSYQDWNDNDPHRYIIPKCGELARLKGYAGGVQKKTNTCSDRSLTAPNKITYRFPGCRYWFHQNESPACGNQTKSNSIFRSTNTMWNLPGTPSFSSRTTIIFCLISKRVFSSQSCWSEQSCSFVYVIADGCSCLDPKRMTRYWSRLPWWDSSIFLLNRLPFSSFSIAFGIASDGAISFSHKYRQEMRKFGGSYFQNRIHRDPWNRVVWFILQWSCFPDSLFFTASSFGGTSSPGNAHFGNASHCYVEQSHLPAKVYSCLLKNESLPKHSSAEPLIQVFYEEEDVELGELQVCKSEKRWVKWELSIHLPTTNNQ